MPVTEVAGSAESANVIPSKKSNEFNCYEV